MQLYASLDSCADSAKIEVSEGFKRVLKRVSHGVEEGDTHESEFLY